MRHSARRILLIGIGGFGVLLFITGCTLSGANAAPLTPAGPGVVVTPEVTEDPLPLPTEDPGVVDVFGTQTAQAAEAAVATEEVTPEPIVTEEATEEPTEEAMEEPTEEATEEPTEEAVATEEPSSDGDCPGEHVVQAGENLFRIALSYGLTTDQLAAFNGITNPDELSAGQVLQIPCGSGGGTTGGTGGSSAGGTSHTVQPGENLYRIALNYGTTYQALAAFNDIPDPAFILAGSTIQIPASN